MHTTRAQKVPGTFPRTKSTWYFRALALLIALACAGTHGVPICPAQQLVPSAPSHERDRPSDDWPMDEGLAPLDARLRTSIHVASQHLRPQATAANEMLQRQFRIDPGFGMPGLDVVMVVPKEPAKQPLRRAHTTSAALTTALHLIRRAGLPRIMLALQRTRPLLQLIWRHPQRPVQRMEDASTSIQREAQLDAAPSPGAASQRRPLTEAIGHLPRCRPSAAGRFRGAHWRWDGMTVAWLTSRGPPAGRSFRKSFGNLHDTPRGLSRWGVFVFIRI